MKQVDVYHSDFGVVLIPDCVKERVAELSKHLKSPVSAVNDKRTKASKYFWRWADWAGRGWLEDWMVPGEFHLRK